MDFPVVKRRKGGWLLFSNPGDKVRNKMEKYGTNLSPTFNKDQDLVQWIGERRNIERLVRHLFYNTDILYVVTLQKCQHNIFICSYSPIQGTVFL